MAAPRRLQTNSVRQEQRHVRALNKERYIKRQRQRYIRARDKERHIVRQGKQHILVCDFTAMQR